MPAEQSGAPGVARGLAREERSYLLHSGPSNPQTCTLVWKQKSGAASTPKEFPVDNIWSTTWWLDGKINAAWFSSPLSPVMTAASWAPSPPRGSISPLANSSKTDQPSQRRQMEEFYVVPVIYDIQNQNSLRVLVLIFRPCLSIFPLCLSQINCCNIDYTVITTILFVNSSLSNDHYLHHTMNK